MRQSISDATDLEQILINELTRRGIRFRFQPPLRSGFVPDFLLPNKIIIETDGPTHDSSKSRRRDRFRDEIIKSEGYTIHRISYKVLNDPKTLGRRLDKLLII